MLLRNRPLLVGMLVAFFLIQLQLSVELMASGFNWRPLWGTPFVRATLMDFLFTVAWCAFYVLDTARRQGRNGWAWLPLLLILPTLAMFLFTLTTPDGARQEGTPAAREGSS